MPQPDRTASLWGCWRGRPRRRDAAARHGSALLPGRERGALRSALTAPAWDTRPLCPGKVRAQERFIVFSHTPRPCWLGKVGQKQPSLRDGRRWGSATYQRRGLKPFGGCLVWICALLPTQLLPPRKVLYRVVLCSAAASLFWLHLPRYRPDSVLWVHPHQLKLLAQKPPFFPSTLPQPSHKDLSPEQLNSTFLSHQAPEQVSAQAWLEALTGFRRPKQQPVLQEDVALLQALLRGHFPPGAISCANSLARAASML